MSTATMALSNQRIGRTPGHTATIYLKEAKYEFLKNLRLRMYTASVLSFPIMFYVLFGLVLNQHQTFDGTSARAYLIATYGTFGVMGASLFGTAAGLASDRGLGWLQVKRASPMPPFAYFTAKVVTSMTFSTIIVLALFALGIGLGGVRMPLAEFASLLGTLAVGSLPFSALGLALGYFTGPNSAPSTINLIYLPMSFCSGLWVPIMFLAESGAADRARVAAVPSLATGSRNRGRGAARIEPGTLGGAGGVHHDLPGRGTHRLPSRPGQNVRLEIWLVVKGQGFKPLSFDGNKYKGSRS